MKHKALRAFVALFALLLGLLTMGGAPAQAAVSGQPWPADTSHYKFWSKSICVDGSAINGPYYRVAYIAQQWNLKAPGLALDYEDDCAAAGYPPSRRMVIGIYDNPSDYNCLRLTNGGADFYNGAYRWTDGPGHYINVGQPTCIQDQTHRDHIVSEAIGVLLGLRVLNSAGYNSRVMNNTEFSWLNVPLPDSYSGARLVDIYNGLYCTTGSSC